MEKKVCIEIKSLRMQMLINGNYSGNLSTPVFYTPTFPNKIENARQVYNLGRVEEILLHSSVPCLSI